MTDFSFFLILRHAFQNHDAVEKWGDWNSPTMLNMLLRATQKAQRLMAYKKKKNNLEERNSPNLLSEGSQDSIYEQHVKRPQARPCPFNQILSRFYPDKI